MPREDVVQVPAIGKGLCVSNVFQSNMVLQRNKPAAIWGWAAPGEKVTVSFAGQTANTAAGSDRSWKVTLKAMPANSTPQVMTIKGKDKTLKLENILIGDVWVLGGQSNMEFEIAKIDDGALEIVSANFPQIRLLSMPWGKGFDSVKSFERLYEWSSWFGRHFRKGDWEVCSPETVKEFTAIGYVFGRRVHMAAQVPIGLIDASIGGTTVETWTPEAVLRKIQGRETREKLQEWQDKIAGYDAHADLQKRIANYERRKQKLAEQGNPLPASSRPPSDLRPGPVADRNRPGYCYASVIRPTMSTSIKTKDDSDGKMKGFAIAGKDRRFYPADVQWYTDGSVDNRNQPKYQRHILVLSSPFVPDPIHFRHAWARNPISNIVNGRGIPLATQRSDDWILEETPVKVRDFDKKN